MVYTGYLSVLLNKHPVLLLQNAKIGLTSLCAIVPNYIFRFISFFLRYSYFFKQTTLCDLGGYEVPLVNTAISKFTTVLWYIFKLAMCDRFLIFSLANNANHASIESLFRNARWLEREASEFFGLFFTNKSDRRALFTIPLFYNYPLRKKYPTGGFYEIFFCPIQNRLQWKPISWQN